MCGQSFRVFPCRKTRIKTCSSRCKGKRLSLILSHLPNTKKVAVQLYQNGKSLKYVALKFKVHTCTIREWLKETRVKIRNKQYSGRFKNEAIKLYTSGLTQVEVSSIMGVSRGALRMWLLYAGIIRLQKGRNSSPNIMPKQTDVNYNIRNSRAYLDWRISVFNRDIWTCQSCGIVGTILHCHHIVAFSENQKLRTEPSNGITLCGKCHIKLHMQQRREVAS